MQIDLTFDNYINVLHHCLLSVDQDMLYAAADEILKAKRIYVCGNGGSAAIADHLVCDCLKGIRTNTKIKPKVISLTSNVPLITAIANDFGYENIFSHQLESLGKKKDLLIVISSSGNSPNIIEAIRTATAIGMTTIGFCGFDGGEVMDLVDIPIYVGTHNYGIVEDAHQACMHMIAQYISTYYKDPTKSLDDLIL